MGINRVKPSSPSITIYIGAPASDKKEKIGFKGLLKRTAKWTAMVLHLPVACLLLPLTCCLIAPTLQVATPMLVEALAPDERATANFCIGGVMCVYSTVTCCFCCGKCCTVDPEEAIYDISS
jgi:hypothetical protein